MKFRFSKRTLAKVIVFTALSAVMTVILAIRIGNLRLFADTYELQAEFSDASGVFRGDAVKLAGVDVGRVTGAEIEDGRAVVSFTVDQDVELARDTVVALRWRNVLGQRFLYVYPGDDRTRILEAGDHIPQTQTENAGDLTDFLNKLGPILQAIDPVKANAFLDAVNGALAGNEAAVRSLIADGSSLAGDLGAVDGEIETLLQSSSVVMDTFAGQDEQIEAIIDDLDVLGAELQGMTDDVNTLLVSFADVQEELDRLLRTNRSAIDRDLENLDVITGVLETNRENLEQTLCTVPAGLAGYFQTTSWGEWFNVRVTTVILKDSQGNTVSEVAEAPNQTDPEPAPPLTDCAEQGTASLGARIGQPAQRPGTGGAGTGGGGSGETGPGPGADFDDVGGLLDWVLEGSGG